MAEITVGRIRKHELPAVVSMWREAFRGELAFRGMDLGALEPVFRLLLSGRRLPLALLHRLGVPVEIWVLRVDGRPVGSVGQIGFRIPYIIGLVLREGMRDLRLVRLLERGMGEALKRAGFSLMRALVPHRHPIAKLGIKLGWEEVGRTVQFVLPLENDLPSGDPRLLPFKAEERLARRFHAAGEIRPLLAVERNYGGPWARLFGFREGILAADGGLARVSWNRYQPVAFMHVPHLERGAYERLLFAAIGLFRRLGKRELHLDLWEDQGEEADLLRRLGATRAGTWTYLIKRL